MATKKPAAPKAPKPFEVECSPLEALDFVDTSDEEQGLIKFQEAISAYIAQRMAHISRKRRMWWDGVAGRVGIDLSARKLRAETRHDGRVIVRSAED